MDNGKLSVLVLLDLSAAFDTIDYDILLYRLQYVFGIQGTVLSWFRSYLTKIFQIVSTQGTHSDQIELCCGVPQGPVLGSILVFFIHNLSLVLFIIIHYLTCCMLMIHKYTNHLTWMIVCLLFFVFKSVYPMSKPR